MSLIRVGELVLSLRTQLKWLDEGSAYRKDYLTLEQVQDLATRQYKQNCISIGHTVQELFQELTKNNNAPEVHRETV